MSTLLSPTKVGVVHNKQDAFMMCLPSGNWNHHESEYAIMRMKNNN